MIDILGLDAQHLLIVIAGAKMITGIITPFLPQGSDEDKKASRRAAGTAIVTVVSLALGFAATRLPAPATDALAIGFVGAFSASGAHNSGQLIKDAVTKAISKP